MRLGEEWGETGRRPGKRASARLWQGEGGTRVWLEGLRVRSVSRAMWNLLVKPQTPIRFFAVVFSRVETNSISLSLSIPSPLYICLSLSVYLSVSHANYSQLPPLPIARAIVADVHHLYDWQEQLLDQICLSEHQPPNLGRKGPSDQTQSQPYWPRIGP